MPKNRPPLGSLRQVLRPLAWVGAPWGGGDFRTGRRCAWFIAAIALLAICPASALAQFNAPKTVEQLEREPAHKARSAHAQDRSADPDQDAVDPNEGLPTDTGPDPDDAPTDRAQPPAQLTPPTPAEKPVRAERHHRHGREVVDAGAPDAGPADGGALGASDGGLATVEAIVAPESTEQTLLDAWEVRRKAVLGHNPKSKRVAEAQILKARTELGIGELTGMAAAIDKEALGQLRAKNPVEANRLADLAVALAPGTAHVHFAQARIRLAGSLGNVLPAAEAVKRGVVEALSSPGSQRAFMGNVGLAVALGFGVAAVLALLALALRPLRYALHDFHHLFPRGALPAQTAVLFALVLVLPWAFRLGPLAELCTLACASFLYLRTAERWVATALMALLAALPLAAGFGAQAVAYDGTTEAAALRVEAGGPDADAARALLLAQEKSGAASPQVLFVLGLDAKRAGDYPLAIARFKRSLALDPKRAAAENDLGNALLLSGDLDGARDAYLHASEQAPDSAVINYNLAKVSNRRARLLTSKPDASGAPRDVSDDMERSKAATAAVYRLDRSLMERPADFRANVFVVDLELTSSELAAPGQGHVNRAVAEQVGAWLWGPTPNASRLFAAILLGAFWILAMAARRLRPCSECVRCGRAVCARCDREVAGGALCGQCHNAFAKKGAVDPTTRARKEASARRYQERWGRLRRMSSYVLAGMGHLLGGRPVLGAVFLLLTLAAVAAVLLGEGLFRVPFGSGMAHARQAVGAVLAVALWVLSVRSYRAGDERRV